jgi:hypothetical protein
MTQENLPFKWTKKSKGGIAIKKRRITQEPHPSQHPKPSKKNLMRTRVSCVKPANTKQACQPPEPTLDRQNFTGRNQKGKVSVHLKDRGNRSCDLRFLENAGSACYAVYAFVSLYVGDMYRVGKDRIAVDTR